MHAHADRTLLVDPTAQSKILQGVTTEVIGYSSGTSVYLHTGQMIAKMATAAYDTFPDPAKTEGLVQAATV